MSTGNKNLAFDNNDNNKLSFNGNDKNIRLHIKNDRVLTTYPLKLYRQLFRETCAKGSLVLEAMRLTISPQCSRVRFWITQEASPLEQKMLGVAFSCKMERQLFKRVETKK